MSNSPPHDLPPEQARLGLASIFGSTFLELTGYFMLAPWLLLRLKDADLPTWLAGLFAATAWLGIFLVGPSGRLGGGMPESWSLSSGPFPVTVPAPDAGRPNPNSCCHGAGDSPNSGYVTGVFRWGR